MAEPTLETKKPIEIKTPEELILKLKEKTQIKLEEKIEGVMNKIDEGTKDKWKALKKELRESDSKEIIEAIKEDDPTIKDKLGEDEDSKKGKIVAGMASVGGAVALATTEVPGLANPEEPGFLKKMTSFFDKFSEGFNNIIERAKSWFVSKFPGLASFFGFNNDTEKNNSENNNTENKPTSNDKSKTEEVTNPGTKEIKQENIGIKIIEKGKKLYTECLDDLYNKPNIQNLKIPLVSKNKDEKVSLSELLSELKTNTNLKSYILSIGYTESGFNQIAQNDDEPTKKSSKGIYQFQPGTWEIAKNIYGTLGTHNYDVLNGKNNMTIAMLEMARNYLSLKRAKPEDADQQRFEVMTATWPAGMVTIKYIQNKIKPEEIKRIRRGSNSTVGEYIEIISSRKKSIDEIQLA